MFFCSLMPSITTTSNNRTTFASDFLTLIFIETGSVFSSVFFTFVRVDSLVFFNFFNVVSVILFIRHTYIYFFLLSIITFLFKYQSFF